MTQTDTEKALESQPHFHMHWEYHGRWAQHYNDQIKTALATQSKIESGEYVLVPREPTEEMINAFIKEQPAEVCYCNMRGYDIEYDDEKFVIAYKAMIAAQEGSE